MNVLLSSQSEKLEKMLSKVGDLGFKRRVKTILNWLDIQPNEQILDCGCGEGFYSMVISSLYPKSTIIAFDQNAELLKMAAGWVKGAPQVVFKNGNIEQGLPFSESSIDKIIFTEVLEHLDDDETSLSEVFRILKPGGLVALTVPNINYPFFWDPINCATESIGFGHFNPKNTILGGVWSYDHKRLYSIESITTLAKKVGFEVVDQVNLTHYCMPFNYLILRLGKIISTVIAPPTIKKSMEKFEWESTTVAKKTFWDKFLNLCLSIFEKIDQKNDSIINNFNYSSVSVGLKLKKPLNPSIVQLNSNVHNKSTVSTI